MMANSRVGEPPEKLDVDEGFGVVGITGNLGQNRDANADSHQGFHRGDLGAAEADPRLKVMVAAEALDLAGEGAGAAENDEGFVGEIGGLDAGFAGQGAILADDEQEGLGEKRFDGETGVFDRERDNGEVDLALDGGAGEVGAKILPHVDLEIGVALAAAGDESGQNIRGDRRDRAHCNAALQSGMIAEFFSGVFDFEKNPARAFEEDLAGFREDRFAAKTVKELTANLGFEIYYLLT